MPTNPNLKCRYCGKELNVFIADEEFTWSIMTCGECVPKHLHTKFYTSTFLFTLKTYIVNHYKMLKLRLRK